MAASTTPKGSAQALASTVNIFGQPCPLIPHDLMYGPQGALIAECFTGRFRYSGASLGYQLASVIAAVRHRWLRPRYSQRSDQAMRSRYISCSAPSSASLRPALLPDYTNRDTLGGIRPSLADFDHAGSAKDGFTFAIFC